MARRSARIASSSKSATPAPKLGSVFERDESSETPTKSTRSLAAIASSPMPPPATPSVATHVKLPMSEMHPSKVHATTAAPSSGAKLGFVDIDYTKNPAQRAAAAMQSTPSKTPMPSSEFTFRYTQLATDGGLSPAAKKMMEEVREDAAKIKAELAAQREQEKQEETASRKIRQAKGKAGRFSAVHMAQFKKMDSIENHPSAYRAAPDRVTPVKSGIKRSQSKANLDEPNSVPSKKFSTRPVPSFPENEKRQEQPESPVKRAKQRSEDDVSNLRPVSRDASFIPRPKSSGNDSIQSGIPRSQTLSHLMTPTKSSIARSTSVKTPTVSLVKSPSKPDLHGVLTKSPSKPDLTGPAATSSKKGFGGLKMPTITNNLDVDKVPTHVQTPGRFDRVKSILKRQISGSKSKSKSKSHIPQMATSPSKTSLHLDLDKELPQPPLTTPGRKLERRVEFTPMTKRATLFQDSPSPVKSSIPRSKTMPRFQSSNSSVDKSTTGKTPEGEVAYPDLSAYCRDVSENTEKSSKEKIPESVPGTFTFRSDHTISFDSTSPTGFGSASGQSSLRQVRDSVLPTTRMPGSFPRAFDASPNKENKEPVIGTGIPHGMSNKKRHRVSWDEEEEDEANKRVTKKLRKNPTAEGYALVAPRLAGIESPAKKLTGSRTPSPKKKGGLSLSRLNMLARPKVRK